MLKLQIELMTESVIFAGILLLTFVFFSEGLNTDISLFYLFYYGYSWFCHIRRV